MTEMPSHWRVVQLQDVADTSLGKMLDQSRPRGDLRVPYLRNVNVRWGRIDTDDVLTVELSEEERKRFELKSGDLLVCEGGDIGRAAIWGGSTGYMAYQKALHRVRSNGAVELPYLRYLLEHYSHTDFLRARATGSTILHLPQQQLRSLPVPLPPLNEQRRIVEILEGHLSRLESAQQSLRQVEVRSQAMFRRHCGRWLENAEGRSPRWASIAELTGGVPSSVVIGPFGSSLKTSDYTASGVPLVFVRNVRSKSFRSELRFVSRAKAFALAAHTALPGDLLITKMGDPPGDVAVFTGQEPAIVTADVIRLRPSTNFDARYLAYAFNSPAVRRQIESITRGVAQKKVSLARFRSEISVPVYEPDVQMVILSHLDDVAHAVARLEGVTERARGRSLALRRALLRAAFSGHLTRRRADDEFVQELADV